MTRKTLIIAGWLIHSLALPLMAQHDSLPHICTVILDEDGEVYKNDWLNHVIEPDSLSDLITKERISWSLSYNQAGLSDSLRNSIATSVKERTRFEVHDFVQDLEPGDTIWAVHIRPQSKHKESALWNESEGFILVRDCQVEKHWITLELEVSG